MKLVKAFVKAHILHDVTFFYLTFRPPPHIIV